MKEERYAIILSGVATLTGIYLIATLGVSILVGFTGLFSLGSSQDLWQSEHMERLFH